MPRKLFGLPYKGSKNLIAKDIVDVLPSGERLVELFAGGCAITDYAVRNTNKFNCYLVNDLNGWSPQAYVKALAGGFNNEERWISRDDFSRLKDIDPYVKICFSFGFNCKQYSYSPDIEPYFRALHHILLWDDYRPMEDLCPQVIDIIKEYCKNKDESLNNRRLAAGRAIAAHIEQKGSIEYWRSNPMFCRVYLKGRSVKSNQMLPNLRTLERIRSLQSLNSLENIYSDNMDYCKYEYRAGDVVYCDPPYDGTDGYGSSPFDSSAFWEWCRSRSYPVYVSEYKAPEDFVSIWSKEKRSPYCSITITAPRTEHLFLHKKWSI